MNIKVSYLSNGLTIASDPMNALETASVGVWVSAGARNESLELNGISHLLEHMAFKGTDTRSARDIAQEVETVGGYLNAYTTREQTAYFSRVLKDDIPLSIDILSDILQNSVFDNDELSREKSVIFQEIGDANDTPDDVVFDRFQEIAFPNQPLGRNILGSTSSVGQFDRNQIIDYMNNYYLAPNMVLVGAGSVDHQILCDLAEKYFSDLDSSKNNSREPAVYVGGETVEDRDLDQVHLVLGFPSFSYLDPDYYAGQVLSTVLGGGMSSRLFQEVREKRALAYSIFSFTHPFEDSGLFGVYAGTSPSQVDELIEVIAKEIKKISNEINEEEISRARAQHKSGLLMGLESSSARCELLARQLQIHGRPISPFELGQKIDSVDVDSIIRAANRIISSVPSLSLVGPVKQSNVSGKLSGFFQ